MRTFYFLSVNLKKKKKNYIPKLLKKSYFCIFTFVSKLLEKTFYKVYGLKKELFKIKGQKPNFW